MTPVDEQSLRSELDAEDGSFLLQLRCDLVWDVAAFRRLTTLMLAFVRARDPSQDLPRWAAEGFWYAGWFVKSWSEHPKFPRPLPREYYEAAYERLHDLAFRFFTRTSPHEAMSTLERPLAGEDAATGSRQSVPNHDVAAFAREARDFCSFVDGATRLPLAERLVTARRQLCALYAAAIPLPQGDASADSPVTSSPAAPSDWTGFEAVDGYWEVFDPYELAEPVAGSLSDDLLDVYRDLRRGLALWDAGAQGAAVWEWRFSFDTHWGDHAVDALRALHRACVRT